MKTSAVVSVLAMAAAAYAAPTEIEARTGGGGGAGICNNNQVQVCCNGIIGCAVQLLGAGCNGASYCCESNAPVGSLISLNLLNCVSL